MLLGSLKQQRRSGGIWTFLWLTKSPTRRRRTDHASSMWRTKWTSWSRIRTWLSLICMYMNLDASQKLVKPNIKWMKGLGCRRLLKQDLKNLCISTVVRAGAPIKCFIWNSHLIDFRRHYFIMSKLLEHQPRVSTRVLSRLSVAVASSYFRLWFLSSEIGQRWQSSDRLS